VLVDGSAAYLDVARQEARRENVLDRIEFVEGDFVARATAIDPADIVTLDRVICCYPDADALVGLSSMRARTAYGLVLPRDRRLVRIAIRLENLWFRLQRKPYRAYAHSTSRVDEIAAANGLRPRSEGHTFFWRVAVYDRSPTPAVAAPDA
jgi:magnesium-protoporphyrin O-methyltransferase